MSLENVLGRIDADLPNSLDRLRDFLRIPSISTDPAHTADCQAAAEWLVRDLASIGVAADAAPTGGHPAVLGYCQGPGPHLLFYGHYDVQPVDPLDLWNHPPFEPRIEGRAHGKVITGRGACDDKGQLMTFVEACRAFHAVTGKLPCQLTFLFEGEEETGSPNLVPFLEQHGSRLHADLAMVCDTGLVAEGCPGIVTMLRGLVGEEVEIVAANTDLHSGMYGGIAINPIRVLARVLADLHDDSGRITLPGFYDGVAELDAATIAAWRECGFDAGRFLADVGLSQPAGEAGRAGLEMIWSRPTCEINGISGGYAGEGFKTVLPARASSKISFRLVSGQDPEQVRNSFRAHVESRLPPDCSARFKSHAGAPATVMALDNPAFVKARKALVPEWPHAPVLSGCGGSIPATGYLKTMLGMDVLLVGFARDDDNVHAPNEKYDVASFHRGIRSWARILDALSAAN